MCGIAGIWHLDNSVITKDKLKRFTDSMTHRGPDASGYWMNEDESLGLGHRRLSILDLSVNGNQPMKYSSDRYRIVYNGEIFNFLELKNELEAKNYRFYTASDTEVILAAYDCWGKDCLNKFNGMWGIAIYDKKENKLFLARDRFGIKPLYYLYKRKKIFAFASETFAFKFLDGFDRQFHEARLLYNIADPFSLEGFGHTIFEDIYQVLPGHYMEFSLDSESPNQTRWWSTIRAMSDVTSDYDTQVETFRELFFDSVRLRLRSDVPLASALSGGLDSSSVYCVIYKIMNESSRNERTPDNWQKAFIASFPGSAIDETSYAQEVIKFTNGNADYITPDFSNLPEVIRKTTLRFDSIYNTPISAATDIYGSMNAQQIKVSMDGHGVDEMLFGYSDMIEKVARGKMNGQAVDRDTLMGIVSMMNAKDEADLLIASIPDGTGVKTPFSRTIKRLARKAIPVEVQRMLSRKGIVGHHLSLYYNRHLPVLSNDPYDLSGMSTEMQVPFGAFHLRTLPTILRNFDRTSMQNSIEIRMPFMDYRLVSYVFSLPFSSKVGNGYSKRILRDAMKGIIPEKVRNRKWKVGFNAPMVEWFSNELSSFIMDEMNSKNFLQSKLWNGRRLRDFAERKIREKSWTWNECVSFWPIFNAHLLISNNKA